MEYFRQYQRHTQFNISLLCRQHCSKPKGNRTKMRRPDSFVNSSLFLPSSFPLPSLLLNFMLLTTMMNIPLIHSHYKDVQILMLILPHRRTLM